jgi:peptidyl-prolyl cis-trans isomerase D
MALALMRRHRRWLYVFLWIVIAAFIILYIPAFQSGQDEGTPAETVVVVGGLPISVGELQRSYNQVMQNYQQLYQGRLNPAMLRQMGIEEQVLETLVSQRLIELEAKRLGIAVSDEAVARAIATSPRFQNERGFIGVDELRRILELSGMSEEQLAQEIRRDLLRQSLEALVGSAAGVSEAEVDAELARRNEQVKLEYVLADSARFSAQVQPTEAEVQARFTAKKEEYRIPEKRVLSYVLLDREALRQKVAVTDREIETYWQDHQEEFRQEEQACASHVLVKVKQGEAGEGHPEAEARQIAQGVLEKLRAGGDFAEIAKASSEDEGSKQNGGDLGCFAPGRMVREFDDAVFAMRPGQISDLVKSSFGFHVIRLASRTEPTVLPLAVVKERIRATVMDRKMSTLGEEISQAIADALKAGKTLEQAASPHGLAVKKTAAFARGEMPPGLASASLAARAFQMKPGEIEKEGFGLPQGAAFVALSEVQPAREAKLEDVKDKVRQELVQERSLEQARALAAAVAEKAAGQGLEKAATAAGLVRKETPQLTGRGQPLGDLGSGAALEEAAFSLPQGQLSGPVRTPGGFAVIRVLEKKTVEAADLARQRASVADSLREQKRQQLFRAFLVAARDRYAITRNAQAYRRALGERES